MANEGNSGSIEGFLGMERVYGSDSSNELRMTIVGKFFDILDHVLEFLNDYELRMINHEV
jgi:hypothetical protein